MPAGAALLRITLIGDLTPAGVSTIEQLSEALGQAILADEVEIDEDCLEANPWTFIYLPEYVVPYGVGCPPPQAIALDEFYRDLIADLAQCQANEWIVPREGCTPFGLTES